MKKSLLTILFACIFISSSYSQEMDSNQMWIDSVENAFVYEYGEIKLASGNAILTVPEGFRYLNKKQSQYVLSDLWGNPVDHSILGLLVPEDRNVLSDNPWVFTISFDEMGYVKDEDASDIDYDDLLEEQKKEFLADNAARVEQGYEAVELIGWASAPHYDENKKILHWAKEIKFGEAESNTLNYDLRILGRKGLFMLQAVASMTSLPEVKVNIDKVLGSIKFEEGHRYADFLPDVDNVAAWTIGGLVAGKLLAKAGLFVLLLKFWKLIAIAAVAAIAAIKKFVLNKEDKEQPEKEDDAPPV